MKNYLLVNRALAAEKNVNLIEMLQGCSKRNGTTFRQSNPDGQPTVNRQSRLMSHRGYLKNLAMIFAVLVMSVANVGMAWAWNTTYLMGDPTGGWSKNADYSMGNSDANSRFFYFTEDNYFAFYIDYYKYQIGPASDGNTMTTGDGGQKFSAINTSNSAKYTGNTGIVEVHVQQKGNGDNTPWVWLTRPTVYIRHKWNNSSASTVAMTDNNDGTYKYIGNFSSSTSTTQVGPENGSSRSNVFKEFGSSNITKVGSPADKDRCIFEWNASGYNSNKAYNYNRGTLTVTKLYSITYNGNGKTGGSVPTGVTDRKWNVTTTIADNTGSLVKTGCVFVGWNTSADGSGTFYLPGSTYSPSAASITLYAQWLTIHEPGLYETTYEQEYETVGGRDYEVYQYASSSGIYVYAGTSTTSEAAANCMLKYTTSGSGSSARKGWMLHSGGLSNGTSSNTTHSGEFQQNAYELKVIAGNLHIIAVTGFDQFSLYGKDKTASTAEMKIYINGTEKTLSDAKNYKIGRWDLDPETTYIIQITANGTGSNYSRDVGFSLRVPLATCTAPTALAAASPTAKGITLSVTDANDVNNYEFYVSTESTAPEAGATATHSVSSAKSLTITNLVAGTTYYAWARSVCGVSNKSGWTALTGNTFTTSTVNADYHLTNVTKSSGATSGIGGSTFTAVFAAVSGYSLPSPVVTIGGNSATSGTDYTWNAGTGTLTINANKINGDIDITLSSPAAAPSSVAITGDWLYFAGETIELTATPTGGNGPVTYQWYKGGKADGNAIEGETSATYTKASCAFADAGSYYCKVTCGGSESTWGQNGDAYDVKIPRLYVKTGHNYDPVKTDEGNVDFTRATASTATASFSLGANWDYCFNIADGCGHYYGNAGTMQYNNYGPWVTNVNNQDCGLRTTNGATYVFTIDYSDWTQLKTTVTFPSSNQAAGKVIYFDNNVLKWPGSSIYYRIGHSSHSQADLLSLVPGTANLYKMTTREYNGFSGWHIANATGDVGSGKSIYKTVDGTPITEATAHEGASVTATAVTVTPTTSRGNGSDVGINDNCEFYNYTITDGMKTDRVTITAPSNGTLTVNYVDVSGAAQAFSSGNRDLAHTCIITVTAVPAAGYAEPANVSINGASHGNRDPYTITGTTVVAATFSPASYTIALNKGDHGAANQSATVAYLAEELTSITPVTSTGYTLTGYYDGETKVLNADGTFASANVTGYITDSKWTKTSDATLTAKWECVSLTVNRGGTEATPAGGEPVGTPYGTLTCSASTGVIASYQWKQNTTASTEGAVNAVGTGATSASFSPNPAAAGTYYYYCVATDACGNSVNTAFSGVFQFNAAAYTVTYNKNGDGAGGAGSVTGTVPTDANSYSSGQRAVVLEPGDLALSGKTFIGWNDAPNGSGTYYSPKANFAITASKTLYAQWRTASSCPGDEGGTVFSLSMGDNSKGSAKALTYGESVQLSTLSYATVTNGNASFTDIRESSGETKATITKANPALIQFGGAAAMLAIYLDCALQKDDEITITTSASQEVCFTATPSKSETLATSSKTYTIPSGSPLIGKKIIYIWRKGGDTFGISALTITRPASVSATITATLLTPEYMATGSTGVQIGVEITGASTGWYYRVKKGGGYETPNNTTYTTTTWTMTSTIGAGANTYTVELYNGSGTKMAESNAVTVTGETGHPMTIAAGDGGSVSPISTQANGAGDHLHPTITATPSDGYHFVNWTLNNANATLANANAATTTITSASGACTITANFEADATLYTVTFNSNGGSAVSPITQASEDASITMPTPTKSGYTFQGWVIGGTTKAAGAEYTPTANVTAYATWKADCAGGGGSTTLFSAVSTSSTTMSASTGSVTLSSVSSEQVNNGIKFSGDGGYIEATGTSSFLPGDVITVTIYNASGSTAERGFKLHNTSGTAHTTSISATSTTDIEYTLVAQDIESNGKLRIFRSNSNVRIPNVVVVRPGGSCYYVTYNGNGAETGSISDAEAYASGSNVTVLGNTGGSAFTKTGYRFNGWNTSATGKGTAYAAGATISSISADVTLYAQWVADACSAPSAPTISGTSVRTVGQTIELTAFCESGKDARTTYTWYKGDTWDEAADNTPVQTALTIEEGGRIFNKASCVAGDEGTYWCEASNGDDCKSHNATGFTVTVNDAAGDEHIYFYKDDNHYSDGVYSDPEGNTASSGDNKSLSSPWMICNGCKAGVDSVVAHGATYDGKGNHMNAYIKLPTGGNATTKNIKFALTAGYTGTLKMKIGGYENNPTVTLQPLNTSTGVLGDAISYSGTVSGVATTENNFGEITWNLTTPGGTYVLTVTTKTGYISQIDMTTSTSATFNVTYNGNGSTGGSVPEDDDKYASGATVTVAANTGDGKLVKTNYTGAGWNTANNGTGTNYVPGSGTFKITANTTLYAHWTQLITLAPGTQGTGTNNAAVSWNGSVLRGFAAHTASGYALQGYYTEPSGGTKVLNADGSFAATNIDGFVTSGKWSNTGAAPTLYAQWEASNLLKWNLKVNVAETSITTLSKESAAPTVIAVANMGNLTNNGSLTITDNAKSALTSKIATTASATGDDAGKYMSVQFIVAAGYQLVPSDIKVKVQPISHSQTTKLILEDNNSHSISYTSGSLSKGSTHTVTMTNSEEVAFTGTVTLKIYVYGTAENDGYRLGTPIEINGSVEETCIPPTFSGISYSETEYTVDASASAISVTGAENVTSYLWKQNDVNDRSGGTAATGTNDEPSYTPPTSAADTMYYWCEMTNNCTTVKTAAVGIMVRNATTDPTVTWSDVKLNDATATPNYGGGNYVLRATVNETTWPGTLAASMITAPAGITIHHVTTGTADSKRYIEFKFDVTTAFDRASNATIDFNIALPEAGSYSALNSEKSVTYNDCSGGAAGQVAIKMGATASTSKSNPQNYWETAGAGRLMYNYGGNMGSTNNASGYKTADSTFYYYAASTGQKWMFQTYIGGVNKVRVVFRAAGTIKSSKATITNFYYNTEYFASPGSNAVSFGEVSASKAGYSSGEDGYIEFTVPEMAANSYGAFVTGDGNMKVYGVVLYSENAGTGGSVATNPAWSDSKADKFTVNKTQSDANFTYTISTTTNTLGAISYSSSNPSVAAVDPVTGEVTITATGASAQNATITATLARSGCYQGATRTYTINVAGYSCSEPSGSVELTSGSATKCASESVTLTMTGFTEGASIQWYNGESTISNGGGYTITTTATQSTLTTTAAGTYSAIANSSCAAKRTNSITIANMDMSEQKTVRKVSQWYVKNGRLTPDIALWQLGEGETFKSVAWSPSNTTGLDFRTDTETGIVYLEGKEPSTNTSADIPYTLTLTITDACGTDHVLSEQTIKLTHQKNTDKHVLAFVVNGTAKGGFTEGITAAQTTSVGLYNAIAAQFDVQATNIYSTDDEQKLREYYSQYDILCITDYPNTQTKGVNSKSYVDAIGALIDIRPILTMEAFVSALPNWKLKGVSGNPKSPSTRQYTMLLQCKDHEIFSGTKLTKVGEGLDALYRVTMVDKNQEEYKTLDANYGDGEHKANEGYQYGKKPALQGFTYTEEMSDNNMLPLGLIDDGAGNNLQVGIERQTEMEARMMVLGINSYAMERLDKDGEAIVINALKYLMKKSAEDISDCSVYFDGSDETDPTNWDNELNWGPSYASLPLPHQEVRILKECVVKDGVVARASGIKIIPRGRINHDTDDASGSLTIEPGGALIVDGKVRAAVAPNYFNATPTTPSNLVLQSNSSAQAALILDNSEGETQATVQMWNPSYWVVEGGKKKKYWSYVAVPIQEADIPNFFWYGFTYLYDETSGWIKKGDGTSLYPFQGIGASLQTGNMETFYGPLATTESQDITLTFTADKGQGMNLIGNSWTAPIQIANFEEDDFGDAAAEVWVFNTGNKNDGTPGSGSSTTPGQWNTIPINSAGLPGYEGLKVIPAMQAFEVNTTSETTLHLDYDRLVRAGRENLNEPMRAPRRSAAKQIEATMRVRVSGELTHTDVYLLKDARFSDGFDNGWDGHYLSGDDRSAQLYAISEEEGKLAFLAQPEIEGTQLGFAPSKHGNEYTFSFSYDGDEEYYLNDIKLKTSTLISEESTYSFTYADGDTNRFYISRTPIDAPQTSTGVDNTGNGEVKARKFIYRDKMYIMINGRVYSADGALVK